MYGSAFFLSRPVGHENEIKNTFSLFLSLSRSRSFDWITALDSPSYKVRSPMKANMLRLLYIRHRVFDSITGLYVGMRQRLPKSNKSTTPILILCGDIWYWVGKSTTRGRAITATKSRAKTENLKLFSRRKRRQRRLKLILFTSPDRCWCPSRTRIDGRDLLFVLFELKEVNDMCWAWFRHL